MPQRYPWNPGGKSFGPQNYGQYGTWGPVDMGKDFYVWTFAFDRSGIASIKVLFRTDKDGVNSMANNHNETFAGGSDVNPWQEQSMTDRGEFPKTMAGFDGLENINYELPAVIARHYWTKIISTTNTLYDYAIVAVDNHGLATTSDIFHVYVGATSSGGGSDSVVTTSPNPPVRGATCTISYNSAGRSLASASQVNIHFGFNNWSGGALGTFPMTGTVGGVWSRSFFISTSWSQIDCVFNNGAGTWDNNNGQDWHIATVAGDQPPSASFTATPRSGDAPLTVFFSDTSSGSVSFRHWSFGDGNSSSAQNPSNLYLSPGSYTVSLIVSNAFGASTNTQPAYISVSAPGAPQANFSATPLYGPPGTTVQFTDQSGGTVTGRLWSFGDGASSVAQHPAHQYLSSGLFDVQLIAAGPSGISTNRKPGYITISSDFVSYTDGTNILADFAAAPFVLQNTPTTAGDATTPAAGSELDALFVTNTVAALKIALTGNIATNGECLILLIDSKPGGINQFSNSQSFASERLRSLAGLTLESGFAPDFALVLNSYAAQCYVDFEELSGSSKDGYLGNAAGNIFVSAVLSHANTGFKSGFNNSNTGGITATSVSNAGSVSTGWEFDIPWELIDIIPPAQGTLKIQAILAGQLWEGPGNAATRRLTNQSLPGVHNDNRIQGTLNN